MQESELYQWWRWFSDHHLATEDNRLIGISPGFLNTAEGPDFESAEFRLDDITYRGDVEIHVRLKDWQLHGHHLDARYDRVVLHLVWEDIPDRHAPIHTSRGNIVQTISFRHFPAYRQKRGGDRSCRMHKPPDPLLRRIAFDRFQQQGRSLAKCMAGTNRDQVLYRQLLYLIGKPGNSVPFMRLAEVLPWSDIMRLRSSYHIAPDGWYYLFMRLAGLTAPDRTHPEERLLSALPFRKGAWTRGGLRPANRPGNRLYGLAHFIAGLPAVSPYPVWSDLLGSRLPARTVTGKLMQVHRTPGGKGWGSGQALEIIGNIILPCLYLESVGSESAGFADYLADLYFSLPSAGRYGCLRVFRPVYDGRRRFYKDQAFLQIYKNHCTAGACRTCPLHPSRERD